MLFGFGQESIYLSPAPMYHAAPLGYCQSVQFMGGTVVMMDKFDPQAALRLIERYRVTHSQWVPTMFVRMLKLPEEVRTKYDLSSLKCAVHAAAPCPVPVKEQMIAWWGPVLMEYYAGTEGNGMTMVGSADWLTHKGTVGRAVVGELKICNDEGNEVPTGEEGTVYFANGKPFAYHNDSAKTDQSRNAQGWTTLGDVGRVDAEGFLYLTDRKAYMIISGGVNIYPQETENMLVSHPRVADAAVFGIPDDEMGQSVKAVVQTVDPADATDEFGAELLGWLRDHLSHYKCPRSVSFEAALPRTDTGKLYKQSLIDKYS